MSVFRTRTCVFLAIASGVSLGLALAQTVQPGFRTTTLATEIEVAVSDATGAAPRDLTSADFVVEEDGVRQRILHVEFLGGEALMAPSAVAPADAGVVVRTNRDMRTSRAWVLLVDDLRVTGVLRDGVKAALRAVVDGIPDGTWIALVPTSGDRRVAHEFTTDRRALLERIERLRFMQPIREAPGLDVRTDDPRPGGDGTPTFQAGPDLREQSAIDHLLSSLGNIGLMLGRAGARHATIVLVSAGLPLAVDKEAIRARSASGGGGADKTLQRIAEIVEAIDKVRRGGATIHVMDPTAFDAGHLARVARIERGFRGRSDTMATSDDPHAAARVAAERTGGVYVRAPGSGDAAAAVLAATRDVYRVSYMPADDARDERLREVRVEVLRPGLTVRARTAYARVTDRTFEAQRATKPLGAAVASALPNDALGLRVSAQASRSATGRPSMTVVVTLLDAPDHGDPPTDTVEVLALAIDRRGRTAGKAGGRFDVRESEGSLTAPPLRLENLSSGRYQLRIAARSLGLDRVGSVFLDVDVP
ncbi:MAG: VWA domain-containing protein [Acidobacteria bacterium]|nr:VWA domain-containing protein [Acidobacteriota bacterium]